MTNGCLPFPWSNRVDTLGANDKQNSGLVNFVPKSRSPFAQISFILPRYGPENLKLVRKTVFKKWNTNLHLEYSCTDQVNRSAYYLYGNVGENFPSNSTGLVFFSSPKTGMGLCCAIYNFRRKCGTDNPNRWFRKFRSFR